ncbi:hypothetical protein BDF14DRAFT_1166717 [Spinellus fusiger]|nr:hypothetical protein BDF14DRAFT_1166717 [Spinellus fusiger]
MFLLCSIDDDDKITLPSRTIDTAQSTLWLEDSPCDSHPMGSLSPLFSLESSTFCSFFLTLFTLLLSTLPCGLPSHSHSHSLSFLFSHSLSLLFSLILSLLCNSFNPQKTAVPPSVSLQRVLQKR